MEYWTIEVLHGAFPARMWQDAHGDTLVEAAQTHGVLDWQWSHHPWAVVLEVLFRDESNWTRFRALPTVRAALDAVPDPVSGLLIYSGRGGASGVRVPRWPTQPPLVDAAAEPIPEGTRWLEVDSDLQPPPFALAGS